MRKLLLLAALCLPTYAQTTIADTLYIQSPTPWTGTIRVSWPAFTNCAGTPIAKGFRDFAVNNGVVSIALWPSTCASPSFAYSATYRTMGGTNHGVTYDETWAVPETSPVTLAAVRLTSNLRGPAGPTGATGATGATGTSTAADIKNALHCADTSVSANAITCAPSGAYASYSVGTPLLVKVANTNTGASTINVNSLGTKAITTQSAAALSGGELVSGGVYLLGYDGTRFQIVGGGSGGGSYPGVVTDGASGLSVTGAITAALGFHGPAGTAAELGGAVETSSAATLPASGEYTLFLLTGGYPAVIDHSRSVVWQAPTSSSTTVNGQSCTLGSTCTVTADPTSAQYKTRVCEIHIWGSGTSQVLQDTDDEAASCYNGFGATETITAVKCWANAGTPTVTPIITGGSSTSILTGALTCGTASWASGTLNGTPTLSSAGTIDANVTTAGGTATNIRIVFTLTR